MGVTEAGVRTTGSAILLAGALPFFCTFFGGGCVAVSGAVVCSCSAAALRFRVLGGVVVDDVAELVR
jgi:hypothetical protein